jgi:hypothetical protein
VTLPARIVFAALVAATFGAFFVAQRLKHSPRVVEHFQAPHFFSPNHDGRFEREPIRFAVKHTDDITAEIVNIDGDFVRTLFVDRHMVAGRQTGPVYWNGRTDNGTLAPDGLYRVRVTLRREGRSLVVLHAFALDTTPPQPRVTSIGPTKDKLPRPELLPNRTGRVTIHTTPPGRDPTLEVYKTSGAHPGMVARLALHGSSATWDGMVGGRRASAGTYVAVARWADAAGNIGSSVPVDPRTGRPVLRYGERLPGRGGITVRYLEMQPPTDPVAAGQVATIGVDARGQRYRWTLRRVGEPRPIRRGVADHSPFHIHAPRGRSGVFIFEAHTRTHSAVTPLAVTGTAPEPVLVVLPYITWQGRNPVDDDGDGAPNVLDRGVPAKFARVLAAGRLPQGFIQEEGPLLSFLGRHRLRYDLTTDLALAQRRGPQLAGHHGVVLPGDVRWLPGRLQLQLRRFVRRGGTLMLTGLDSLRREVRITSAGRLDRPTAPATTNLFGSKLKPVVHKPVTVTNLTDHIQLFTGGVLGGTGVFRDFAGYEATGELGPREQLQANAVTPDGQTVIVASRFGEGLVIRTGLLDFATRLNRDANSAALVQRAWTLLSR